MSIKRRTMKFLIPLTVDSLGRSDLSGRAIVPCYINPQSFSIQDGKIINETLTKGGYVIQYWGEQLAEIQVSGTTGSGGIEAVNILKSVYRNEITQFNNILLERALNQDQNFREALEGTEQASLGGGITSIVDEFTRNGFSGIVNGISSVIDEVTTAAIGVANSNPASVELIPSAGAFAVSMILYWQGEKFQGFFTNFRVDENASTPGHFDYQFSFKVTKRSGVRKNFMPWHRSPTDNSGSPTTVSIPNEGARIDELSFITSTQANLLASQGNLSDGTNSITSDFQETQESTQNDPNQVSINRSSSIRGN